MLRWRMSFRAEPSDRNYQPAVYLREDGTVCPNPSGGITGDVCWPKYGLRLTVPGLHMEGGHVEFLSAMWGSHGFADGLMGGSVLGIVNLLISWDTAIKIRFANLVLVAVSLVVSAALFAAVGGVLGYYLSKGDGEIGAFFTGITAVGFVALFLGNFVAPNNRGESGAQIRNVVNTSTERRAERANHA